MNIIRWEPRSNWFEGFGDSILSDLFPERIEKDSGWVPKIEVEEKDGTYMVKAELAGIDKKDISVDLHDGLLTIKAAKKQEKEEKKKGYSYSEFRYGSFQRSIAVPKSLKTEDIKASYNQGILEITLPKVEEEKAQMKKIEIN